MRAAQVLAPAVLPIAGRNLDLPVLFPSVSSVKTNLKPFDYVELLVGLREPQFLVSAYDFSRAARRDAARMAQVIERAAAAGCCILLDSGNYESFWHRDHAWSPKEYFRVLGSVSARLAFCFDDQRPSTNVEKSTRAVCRAVDAAQRSTERATVCPIVHGSARTLARRSAAIATRLRPLMLAVPERSLGDGLIARVATVRTIRDALNEVHPDCVLHLLGTGNPTALLMYSVAGAQSFDGLEWCQTCADPSTGMLRHFQHRELVPPMASRLVAKLPYAQATLAHNLLFFRQWMKTLRKVFAEGNQRELLEAHLPARVWRPFQRALRGVAP